jgi:hypothetical protein
VTAQPEVAPFLVREGWPTTRQESNWEALILKIFSKTFSDIQQNRKVVHDGLDKKPLLGE